LAGPGRHRGYVRARGAIADGKSLNSGIPEISMGHVIGKMIYVVEYAEHDCWVETCKEFLTYSKEHCYKKHPGTEREIIFNESQFEIEVNYQK
jgi:hypothetical protein